MLTLGEAALLTVIDRYNTLGFGASLVEVQKLMYFLQEAGEDLNLRYQAHRYGPYADNLRHVLIALKGRHLAGFGDGSRQVNDAESIQVLNGAIDEALTELGDNPTLTDRLDRVLRLIEGYESPYGMELLATVHWVIEHEAVEVLDEVIERVRTWSRRKARMFTPDHITTAYNHLVDDGWIAVPQPA